MRLAPQLYKETTVFDGVPPERLAIPRIENSNAYTVRLYRGRDRLFSSLVEFDYGKRNPELIVIMNSK
jgi:hypothetical protein